MAYWGGSAYPGSQAASAQYPSQGALPSSSFRARVLYDWQAQAGNQLTVRSGQTVLVLDTKDVGWYGCQLEGTALTGYIPSSYAQAVQAPVFAPYVSFYQPSASSYPTVAAAVQPQSDAMPLPVNQQAYYASPPVGSAVPHAGSSDVLLPSVPASTPIITETLAPMQSSTPSVADADKRGGSAIRTEAQGRSEGDRDKKPGAAKHDQERRHTDGPRKDSSYDRERRHSNDLRNTPVASALNAERDKERDREKKDKDKKDKDRKDKEPKDMDKDKKDKEKRSGSEKKRRYVLWLGNESDFSRVQRSVGSHANLVAFARMSEAMSWFSSHSAESTEAVRLVTSRVRQGEGDEQAAEQTVTAVRKHARFNRIPVLIFCGSVHRVASLYSTNPPTYITASMSDVEAFCTFRDTESLKTPPSTPALGGPASKSDEMLLAPPAYKPSRRPSMDCQLPIIAPGANVEDAEALWNDLDYQEEQAALSEEERFEQLHQSAFRKSMRRKTMKQMKAVEEARKLAHAMQQGGAAKPAPGATLTVPPPVPVAPVPTPVAVAEPEPKRKKKKRSGITYCFEHTPLPQDITESHLKDMITQFEKNRVLGYDSANNLISHMIRGWQMLGNVQRLTVPSDGSLTVVGDLHGQLSDLLHILKERGLPSSKHVYLFNGDIVDRGANGCEVLFLIYAMKVQCPNGIFINRGNHETKAMNAKYTFEEEVMRKYDKKLYNKIQDSFEQMPICTVIDGRVAVIHGGLVSGDALTISKIDQITRQKQPPIRHFKDPLDKTFSEMLWSDPRPEKGVAPSRRGAGIYWGPDVTERFLVQNRLELLVRSHEVVPKGAAFSHVFSASNYCGKQKNEGAYLVFKRDNPRPTVTSFRIGADGSNEAISQDAATEDLIVQLSEKVFANRHRLREFWGKDKRITTQQWDDGMQQVLKIYISWPKVRSVLCKVDRDGTIVVEDFLKSFQLRLPTDLQMLFTSNETMQHVVEGLYAQRAEAKRIFRSLDTDGNGVIDEDEFQAGLEALGLVDEAEDDAPNPALFPLFKLFDTDNSGDIDYEEFSTFMNSIQLIRVRARSEP